MGPPNLNFWYISSEENLNSQQKHALRKRFMRALLCPNDKFNPGCNRKKLIRKGTSILEKGCFNYEQCFIQYNAQLVNNVKVAQLINSFSQE